MSGFKYILVSGNWCYLDGDFHFVWCYFYYLREMFWQWNYRMFGDANIFGCFVRKKWFDVF